MTKSNNFDQTRSPKLFTRGKTLPWYCRGSRFLRVHVAIEKFHPHVANGPILSHAHHIRDQRPKGPGSLLFGSKFVEFEGGVRTRHRRIE